MGKDTKTALLNAAEQAARARGFDGFSYADLAEAVGIRKASIHYHFPSKANLSEALVDRYHLAMVDRFAEIDAINEDAGGRLQGLVQVYRDALNDGTTLCLCVSLTASRESLSPEVIAKINAFRVMVLTWMETVFALGQEDGSIAGITDTAQEARATLALLEGAHLAARAEESVETFDQATALLVTRCA